MHDPGHPLYLPLRLLHILGAMVFLGALVVALWWKLGADRAGDAAFAAKTHRRLRQMDGQIIGPAAIVTFAAGYAMVRFLGGRIAQHLFVLFGLIFLFAALGLWYFGMRYAGEALADATALDADYAKRSAIWVGSAGLAVALVVLAAVFMVFRLPSG